MAKYSIVVPAYNEEKTLRLFYGAVVPVFESLREDFEIVFVNDGSTDKTQEILSELASSDKRIKVCRFSRNFGQQAALLCGLERAIGDAVIAMDADLQDSPQAALLMIEKWKEGYEIVHGKRRKRVGESAFKKRTADLFYALTRKITGLDIPSNVGDFKLYDRKVVDALVKLGEHDRLLRAQTAWLGFKQAFVEFDRPERVAGETHYTVKKMVGLAQSGIFPNTDAGLTLPIKLGTILGGLSLACMIVFIVLACLAIDFGGLVAWLFPTVGLLTSIVLICQGLANIHTAMIYKEVQNRPKYIISEEINF
ncbi:MAG: glycosyltransferase family 2 protein [Clostridia bacterium]|nr:glycosyltransferase family 2 protein [Clostridia bacterium]